MLKISIVLALFIFILGCKETIIEEKSLLNSLVGQWEVEIASLDGNPIEDWNRMAMTIKRGEDSLSVDCVNQPNDKRLIWPNISNWFYIPINETTTGEFVRNDSIDLRIYLNEDKLNISLYPPREWSYNEDCPNDNSSLICSEQGQWLFVLTKI